MRLMKQAMGVFAALVVLAVIAAFIAPKRTHALVATLVQIVPGGTTHVGQNESQLVSLECVSSSGCLALDAKGDSSTTGYVVPAGYTLIVTDYEWQSGCGTAGLLLTDKFYDISNGFSFFSVSGSIADANGFAYAHEHYATGVRVGSGVALVDYNGIRGCGSGYIQGYLVAN